MVKLEGVKVIDMVDGEVTKVTYNGEEYKLTEYEVIVEEDGEKDDAESTPKVDKAKKGDIVRVTDSSMGHNLGTIGEVVDVTSDGVVLVEAMYKGGTEEFYEHYVELVARKEDRRDV